VITSWLAGESRNLAVAYQEENGQIYMAKREAGEWTGPYLLTGDGVNPAITTTSNTPYAAWTEVQQAPYRVMVENVAESSESQPVPDHRRSISFNLKNSLSGAQTGNLDGDIILNISDPEISTTKGIHRIKFSYYDSLVTPANAFQTRSFQVTDKSSQLRIPVTIQVQNFTSGTGLGDNLGNLPVLEVQLKNASSHQVLQTVNSYNTRQFIS
jgi:hypothetical protein